MPYDFTEEAKATNEQLTQGSESSFSEISNHCPWRSQKYSTLKNQYGENIWYECSATNFKCHESECAILHFSKYNKQGQEAA